MIITPIKTHKITTTDKDILKILDQYVTNLKENSIVAVTSKIISITQGRVVEIGETSKDELIQKEADYYLEREENKYDVAFTITNNFLVASAGVDESNGNGFYILWPENLQETTNKIRNYLRKKFNLKNLGIIITDSRTIPLRWGVIGMCLAYSGFKPLKDYIGKSDIFGREFKYEKLNITDSLASTAVLAMGEGNEQTPLATLEALEMVEFVDNNPTKAELKDLKISLEEDLYAPFLKSVNWKREKKN